MWSVLLRVYTCTLLLFCEELIAVKEQCKWMDRTTDKKIVFICFWLNVNLPPFVYVELFLVEKQQRPNGHAAKRPFATIQRDRSASKTDLFSCCSVVKKKKSTQTHTLTYCNIHYTLINIYKSCGVL